MSGYINDFSVFLRERKNYSENTCQSYTRDLKQFFNFLQTEHIDTDRAEKINRTNIMAYILHMQKSHKSTSTILRNISTLKTFFRYLMSKGIIKKDPAEDIEIPKAERRMPNIITPEDINALLSLPMSENAKSVRDKAMLEVLYATGMRVSELASLEVDDVNLQLKYIRCQRGGKERIIPIGAQAVMSLERYMLSARPDILNGLESTSLFLNCNGRPMTRQGFWKVIKDCAEAAEIKASITPQTLRHSFAAHMVTNGADLTAVKEMMGHTDISSTQVYARLQHHKLKDVYAAAHPRYN